jgi:hypothetical protein
MQQLHRVWISIGLKVLLGASQRNVVYVTSHRLVHGPQGEPFDQQGPGTAGQIHNTIRG